MLVATLALRSNARQGVCERTFVPVFQTLCDEQETSFEYVPSSETGYRTVHFEPRIPKGDVNVNAVVFANWEQSNDVVGAVTVNRAFSQVRLRSTALG